MIALSAPARAQGWDSKGWVKLGEREVNGRVDHDRIEVGRYEGRFSKLTMYVEHADLELLDFEITFGNGERFHPEMHHFFKEGSRTRVIDVPGGERTIKAINLRYKNVPGEWRARVEVWGFRRRGRDGPAPGAVLLGFARLGDARRAPGQRSRPRGSRSHRGRYAATRVGLRSSRCVVPLDSDLEIIDFEIKFGNGERFQPELHHFFKEGARTRVIDFPGDERTIKFIDFRYRNLPGGGKAKVQVWARKPSHTSDAYVAIQLGERVAELQRDDQHQHARHRRDDSGQDALGDLSAHG